MTKSAATKTEQRTARLSWRRALTAVMLVGAGATCDAQDINLVNSLVVEADLIGAASVRVEVTAHDLKGRLVFELRVDGERLRQGIAVPPGLKRQLDVRAIDAEGRVTHRAQGQLDIGKEVTPPVALRLVALDRGASPFKLTFGSHSVEVHSSLADGKLARHWAGVFDADGRQLPLGPNDIRWNFEDPLNAQRFFPCKGANGPPPPCIEGLPEPNHERDVIMACYLDMFCRPTALWRAVSASWGAHACAIVSSGVAYCWGANDAGQLGFTSTETCRYTSGPDDPIYHSAAWTRNGAPLQDCSTRARAVVCAGGLDCDFVAITTGERHTCALDRQQDVWCWGSNDRYQLGDGNSSASVPQRLPGNLKFASVSAGHGHTCGLTVAGDVYCWGENRQGQSGGAAGPEVRLPQRFNFPGAMRSVTAGPWVTCAIDMSGVLYCWGRDYVWPLIDPVRDARSGPHTTLVPYMLDGHLAQRPAWCVGNCVIAPLMMHGPERPALHGKFIELVAPSFESMCAYARGDMQTICWGMGPPPRAFESANQLTGDIMQFCGRAGGRVGCWGLGMYPFKFISQYLRSIELNFSYPANYFNPITVPSGFAHIDGGRWFRCGISQSDWLVCWGYNIAGQLGNGSIADSQDRPVGVRVH